MDFIVKLPKSEDINTGVRYNSILVIVDKFIKYAHLIFYKKDFTAKQTTYVVLDRVMRYHRILENITSDRDKIFKSNFWRMLMTEIGTKIKLLTTYHSQMNE